MRYTKKKLQVATMLLILFWPIWALAQGLFQRGVSDEVHYEGGRNQGLMQNRDVGEATSTFANQTFGANHEGAFINQTFGQNAPLSNGLLVLLTASAGYIAWSRKKKKEKTKSNQNRKENKKMKRMNLAIMAFTLLIMAFSQCKKQEQSISDTVETISITLRPNNNNGTKADVNPDMGTVVFTQGDVVCVSSNGKFVGTLTHNGNTFSGNITNPEVGQPLYFYFFGNKTPSETLTAGSSTQCSVIISDQTENLPVISCGPSNEIFTGSGLYTAFFYNKCALVKFNVTTPSNSPICITGMKNKVTVDFSQNTVTPRMDGEGVIMLPAGAGENVEKWAILLPQEALESGEQGSAYSQDVVYIGTRGAVPAITENGYLTTGIQVAVTAEVNPSEVPTGAINGKFTINTNGDQVYFSQGNLQYIGSAATPYWKFADNQWDYLGTTTGQNSNDQNVDRDLFGWGTSGYNHGAICYQPWSTSTNSSDYFAYGGVANNLYDQTGQADWGYNAISNGGNTEGQWRTLTMYEWDYLFYHRATLSGIRYVKANVNDINGIILLPDDWRSDTYSLNAPNSYDASFSSNTITFFQWTILEDAGAVFLPAAGGRNWDTVYVIGTEGYYWLASAITSFQAAYVAYGVFFDNCNIGYTSLCRHHGYFVRLVQDY